MQGALASGRKPRGAFRRATFQEGAQLRAAPPAGAAPIHPIRQRLLLAGPRAHAHLFGQSRPEIPERDQHRQPAGKGSWTARAVRIGRRGAVRRHLAGGGEPGRPTAEGRLAGTGRSGDVQRLPVQPVEQQRLADLIALAPGGPRRWRIHIRVPVVAHRRLARGGRCDSRDVDLTEARCNGLLDAQPQQLDRLATALQPGEVAVWHLQSSGLPAAGTRTPGWRQALGLTVPQGPALRLGTHPGHRRTWHGSRAPTARP